MVGKGKAISHGGKALDYAMSKDKAQVLDVKNLVNDTPKEIHKEFQFVQEQKPSIKNNTLRFEVSPALENSKNLTPAEWKKLGNEFLKDMKLTNHQAVITLHTDTKNPHLHIIANRISLDNTAYSDSYIGLKAGKTADKLAERHNFVRASQLAGVKAQQTEKQIRAEIHGIFKDVQKDKYVRNFKDYCQAMQKKGVLVHPTINKQGIMQGYKVEYKGKIFKASEVHRSMSINKAFATDKKLVCRLEKPTLQGFDKYAEASKSVGKNIAKQGISKGLVGTKNVSQFVLNPTQAITNTALNVAKTAVTKGVTTAVGAKVATIANPIVGAAFVGLKSLMNQAEKSMHI